jgi:hypothetical protein
VFVVSRAVVRVVAASMALSGCAGPPPAPPPVPVAAEEPPPRALPPPPPDPAPPPPSFGTFSSTGGLLGEWSISAGFCQSNVTQSPRGTVTGALFARQAGFGSGRVADLITGVGDSMSRIVIWRHEPDRQIELRRELCTRYGLEHELHADGSLSVDVEVDCDVGNGARVVASLHAPACL